MSKYEVEVTLIFSKTLYMHGDADSVEEEITRMIKSGELDLDLEKDLQDYDITDMTDVSMDEETWGCQMYHELKDEACLRSMEE